VDYAFTTKTIWGADEPRLAGGAGHAGAICLEAAGKVKYNYGLPLGAMYGSIIVFSHAAGHAPLAVLILPSSLQGETLWSC
jgi:hypothetical protein